jgi:hypothetical protein
MKAEFITPIGSFTVTSDYKGNKRANWSNLENWNNHLITVSHKGNRTTFDFWASIAEPEIRKRSDLKHAFYCFVSDAISAKESFENFCSELGYNNDSIQALNTYKACKVSLQKLERLTSLDLYKLVNFLND